MKKPSTAASALALCLVLFPAAVRADQRRTLILEDDFERNESQETKDEIGNGWGSNSEWRADGHKQVDLKDGAMHIDRHEVADHGVSVTHPAEFRDGAVELKFMLEDARDSLGLNFADLEYKEVHAGHLFVVKVSPQAVELTDLKTGNMDLEIREARKAKQLTPEMRANLKTKTKRFPVKLQPGTWYHLAVRIDGDTLSAAIDDEHIGRFSSPGIAHPTKRMLRLAVPRSAVVDDVKIFSIAP